MSEGAGEDRDEFSKARKRSEKQRILKKKWRQRVARECQKRRRDIFVTTQQTPQESDL